MKFGPAFITLFRLPWKKKKKWVGENNKSVIAGFWTVEWVTKVENEEEKRNKEREKKVKIK